MANNYSTHSRFVYANYSQIQNAINNGTINANDIIICKDTQEMIIVREDLTLFPIKSKVLRFSSVSNAIQNLNQATSTYAGQIVSILDEESNYKAYIVNEMADGTFGVSSLGNGESSVTPGVDNYNELVNKPITNLVGEASNPIILSSLNDGHYIVTGSYKVDSSVDTVYNAIDGHYIIVTENENNKTIKKVTSEDIIDYIIDSEVRVRTYTTQEWVEAQNFVNEESLNNQLDALELSLEEHIENTIDGNFIEATDDELLALFQ